MRGVNLITKRAVKLTDWVPALETELPLTNPTHEADLAGWEGHPPGLINSVGIEDEHRGFVLILDRPTTAREYDPADLRRIAEFAEPTAGHFFAVDFTSEDLLRRVLSLVLAVEGSGAVLVEDEQGRFEALESVVP